MNSIRVGLLALLVSTVSVAHEHMSSSGKPGDPGQVDQTIAISAEDIKFDPTVVFVRSGETVKFVITNYGKLSHEFMIGDRSEQEEHEREMQSTKGMGHTEPNVVSISPGETKTLVWQFGNEGTLEFACHVPGHYAAGMVGTIHIVTPHPSH